MHGSDGLLLALLLSMCTKYGLIQCLGGSKGSLDGRVGCDGSARQWPSVNGSGEARGSSCGQRKSGFIDDA